MTGRAFVAMERRRLMCVARRKAGELLMIRPTLVLAAALGALTLASCDDYDADDRADYQEAPPVEVAPAAEDSAEPVVAPEVQDPVPTAPPVDTLPPEQRTSEESVQPESDTLFY